MATFWRYLRIQAFVLLCGIVGPIFLVIFFASGADPTLTWMFWTGLLVTAGDVLIALVLTGFGVRSAARMQALEEHGVLALARVTGIHETNTQINGQPLVKLDLHISGPGLAAFTSQDRVVGSISRLPMITNGTLAALVDPANNEYRIDWKRSGLLTGMRPATFTIAEENRTYDLTGQAGPLLDIMRILKTHGIGVDNLVDLRADPAVRRQVQDVVRRAAGEQAAAQQRAGFAASAPGAPPYSAEPPPSTAQRLQELETLRATGAISAQEYTAKRAQIIADL